MGATSPPAVEPTRCDRRNVLTRAAAGIALPGEAVAAPYSAPSAGPPPWRLYRFTFHTAFGVAAAEPRAATRPRFAR